MEEFELVDVGLIPCPVWMAGLDTRCGAGLMLVSVDQGTELVLTIQCGLSHELKGTLLGLFSWRDLARPALYFLEAEDFRELELKVSSYQTFLKLAAANHRSINTAVLDQELRRWANKHTIVPFEVWVIVREHWDAFDKPKHVAVSGGWAPDVFKPEDWQSDA